MRCSYTSKLFITFWQAVFSLLGVWRKNLKVVKILKFISQVLLDMLQINRFSKALKIHFAEWLLLGKHIHTIYLFKDFKCRFLLKPFMLKSKKTCYNAFEIIKIKIMVFKCMVRWPHEFMRIDIFIYMWSS